MVTLFIEGGGESESLRVECRRAFRSFIERAGFKGRMPQTIACGGRANAFKEFCDALGKGRVALLLVDAEGPVTRTSAWEHVTQREGDRWVKPAGATDDQLHLMVQCMEAWFLADRAALVRFYGQGFNVNALPAATAKPESVAKLDLYAKLEHATRMTKTKGRYGKATHSFKLISMLDPALVRQACPWADRFFVTLDGLVA